MSFYYLDEDFIEDNSSANSSPYYPPYYRSMSSINPAFGATVSNRGLETIDSTTAVRNNTIFSAIDTQSTTSAQTSLGITHQNPILEKKSDFECNENKIEFKILVEYLENLRQNNQIFQTNILKELKQMREVMAELKKSIQEMPIRFADAMTQCLDSVNGRSDSLSIDSEVEIVDFFDKIDITNDCKEDNSFVNLLKDSETKTVEEKSISSADKFVFEYNPYLDLDKWLKKE